MKLFLYSVIKILLLPITSLVDLVLFIWYVLSSRTKYHNDWGTYYLTDWLWDSL